MSRHYLRDDTIDIKVGHVLRTLCRAHDISLKDLAVELGMSMSALNERIAGKRRFTAAEVARFADRFAVDPGAFFKDPTELIGSATRATPQSRCIAEPSGQRLIPRACGVGWKRIVARPRCVTSKAFER